MNRKDICVAMVLNMRHIYFAILLNKKHIYFSIAGGQRRLYESANGGTARRPADGQSEMTVKRKRVAVEAEAGSNLQREDADSNDDVDTNGISISEQHYRGMLGDHLKKYRSAQLREALVARFRATAKKKSGK